jgi:hypothetical protein
MIGGKRDWFYRVGRRGEKEAPVCWGVMAVGGTTVSLLQCNIDGPGFGGITLGNGLRNHEGFLGIQGRIHTRKSTF